MRIVNFENVKELYARDKGICHLCLLWVDPKDATKDHIIPVKKLRTMTKEQRQEVGKDGRNLALAHYWCNHERGSGDIPHFVPPAFPSNQKKLEPFPSEHKHSDKHELGAMRCLAAGAFIRCTCKVCVCKVHIRPKYIVCTKCEEHGKTQDSN